MTTKIEREREREPRKKRKKKRQAERPKLDYKSSWRQDFNLHYLHSIK